MISVGRFPFEGDVLERTWEWLNEFPEANFDDYGPKTFSDFCTHVAGRSQHERMWLIKKDGTPCGVVRYFPVTDRLGSMHGICFAKGFCSSEQKREAVRCILDEIFSSGVDKICAGYFADNMRISKFLSDLGAVREGYFSRHTLRQGQQLDMVQVAIFKV